jgi:hypothetical protein
MVLRHNNAALGSMDALYLKGRRHKKPGGPGYGLEGITHRELRFPPVVPDKSFIAHSAQPEIKGEILQFLASGDFLTGDIANFTVQSISLSNELFRGLHCLSFGFFEVETNIGRFRP